MPAPASRSAASSRSPATRPRTWFSNRLSRPPAGPRARASDRLADTVDYGALHAAVTEIVAQERFALLERLGDAILAAVMRDARIARADRACQTLVCVGDAEPQGFALGRALWRERAATGAELLGTHGYATYAAGKWHLAPMEECSAAGPHHNWPLQKGFDRFYGFLQGETDQFHPELTSDNGHIDPPRRPEDGRGRDQVHRPPRRGHVVTASATSSVAARAESRLDRFLAGTGVLPSRTGAARLARQGVIREWIAESRMAIDQARLLTLHAAWKMDTVGKKEARQDISMIKVVAANVFMQVVDRAIQVHGALGYSKDTPLEMFYRDARAARIYDGPDEVHRQVVAQRILQTFKREG